MTGQPYRLPSEAEWEKGARGTDGGIYPWGNQWQAQLCNTAESELPDTTPVGAYPEGLAPMACWIWPAMYGNGHGAYGGQDLEKPQFKYPYRLSDVREDLFISPVLRVAFLPLTIVTFARGLKLEDLISRLVRGGSFDLNERYARCASRFRNYPNYRNNHIGFRVVVSPI